MRTINDVARDLTEIIRLAAALENQAINDANSRLMPGGLAMVALGHVANLEAWENKHDTAERTAIAIGNPPPEIDDDDDWTPPLQTLCYWTEAWRQEHGNELDRRPSITSEAAYLKWALTWAWDNEPRWNAFADDVRTARRVLEDTLRAGIRVERSRVNCDQCDESPRLLKIYGPTKAEDRYKCPACKHRHDEAGYQRAYAKQLRAAGAMRFVPLTDAISTLKAQGRSESTVRRWLGDCLIESYCDTKTRTVHIWWPDAWRLHNMTPTRKRGGL